VLQRSRTSANPLLDPEITGSEICSVTLDGGVRSGIGLPSSAYHLLRCFGPVAERGGGICCYRRDDPIVRAIDQIVQIARGDGPEYG